MVPKGLERPKNSLPGPDRIADILQDYDLGEPKHCQKLPKGYSNLNLAVTTDAGRFLLRFCREKGEDVAYEIGVLGELNKIYFPAAYPVARGDGEFVTRSGGEVVVIYDLIEGCEPELSRETVAETARALAGLNLFANWKKFQRPNAITMDKCSSLVRQFGGARHRYPDLFSYFKEVTEQLKAPLRIELPRGLVHGDVFPDNTIFRGGKLAAIIDWEEVCTDIIMYDVGVAVNGFCFVDNALEPTLVEAFLSEYEAVRGLTAPERELLPHYVRWGAAAMFYWHLQHIMRRKDERKERRARYFMERLRGMRDIW